MPACSSHSPIVLPSQVRCRVSQVPVVQPGRTETALRSIPSHCLPGHGASTRRAPKASPRVLAWRAPKASPRVLACHTRSFELAGVLRLPAHRGQMHLAQGGQGLQEIGDLVDRHRVGDQATLHLVAVELAQHTQLGGAFDSFGHRFEAQP